jgi:hypothetical protein
MSGPIGKRVVVIEAFMNQNFTTGDDHNLMLIARTYDSGLGPAFLSDFVPRPTDMFALGCTEVCMFLLRDNYRCGKEDPSPQLM